MNPFSPINDDLESIFSAAARFAGDEDLPPTSPDLARELLIEAAQTALSLPASAFRNVEGGLRVRAMLRAALVAAGVPSDATAPAVVGSLVAFASAIGNCPRCGSPMQGGAPHGPWPVQYECGRCGYILIPTRGVVPATDDGGAA